MSQTMPFTTEEQMTKVQKFFNEIDKPVCNCQRGVAMCKHTPCIGTVEDMEKLLDAGVADMLSLDCWCGTKTQNKVIKSDKSKDYFEEDIYYLAPSINNKGGKLADFSKSGVCNFLKDDKCSLHNSGLKPIQGKMACCKINRLFIDSQGVEEDIDERIVILNTWNTSKGREVIEKWKKEVNFTGSESINVPENPFDLIGALLSVLKSHSDMNQNMDKLGISKNEDPIKEKIIYEKPY